MTDLEHAAEEVAVELVSEHEAAEQLAQAKALCAEVVKAEREYKTLQNDARLAKKTWEELAERLTAFLSPSQEPETPLFDGQEEKESEDELPY